MADVQVRIKLQNTVGGEISSIDTTSETNNASATDVLTQLSIQDDGINMKSWASGSLSLSDGYVGGYNTKLISQNGYGGYVFGVVFESKRFVVNLSIIGEDIDGIIIYGDKNANQFPTQAYLNNDTTDIRYNDDYIWAIKFDKPSNLQKITITNWNRANYNACITAIVALKNTMTLDRSWLKSVESLSQSSGQPKDIYYGVTPNSGRIEIVDINGEIKDYVKEGIIQASDMPIDLYANGKHVQSHISIDSNYNNESRILTIDLSDSLEKLLDTKYVNRDILLSTNAFVLLKDVLFKMGYSDDEIEYIVGENIVVSTYNNEVATNEYLTVKEYMSNIAIPYGYLKTDTFRETLNKFCTLAQLNLTYKSGSHLPVFVSARPIISSSLNKIIYIPKRNQFSIPSEELFIKNKISTASLSYEQVYPIFENIDEPTKVIPYIIPSDYPIYRYNQSNIESRIELYQSILNNTDENPNIVVLKELLQDVSSQQNPSLNREYYSIVKFTIDKQSFYNEFEAVDNVEFLQPLGNGNVNKFSQAWNMSSSEISIYDSDITDDYIVSLFIAPNGFSALGLSYSSIKLRINDDSIDVFWCFIKMITDSSSNNPTVLRCFNSHALQLKEKKMSSTTITGSETTDIDIDGNELIQINTQYNNQKIYTINQQNIVSDYSKGVSNMAVSISCNDYYFEDGLIAKNWANGDIIDVGDIVKVEGNDKIWKVNGRNFRKVGVPMIDLELQEVRVVR